MAKKKREVNIDEYLEKLESSYPLTDEDREILKLFSEFTKLIARVGKYYSIHPFWITVNEYSSHHLGMLLHQYGTSGKYVSRYLDYWIFQNQGKGAAQYSRELLKFFLESATKYIRFLLDGEKPKEVKIPNVYEIFYFSPLAWLIERMETTWYFDIEQSFDIDKGYPEERNADEVSVKEEVLRALQKGADWINWLNSCKNNDKNDDRCRRGFVSAAIRDWGKFWQLVGWHLLNLPTSFLYDSNIMKKIKEYCEEIAEAPLHKINLISFHSWSNLQLKRQFAELEKAKKIIEKYGDDE
jgi:hypothetical protein